MKCHHASQGCSWVGTSFTLQDHVTKCAYSDNVQTSCRNSERGCGWEGSVGVLQDHMTTCGFTLIPCPIGCGEFVRRNKLPSHDLMCPEKELSCELCGVRDKLAVINGVHQQQCWRWKLRHPRLVAQNGLQTLANSVSSGFLIGSVFFVFLAWWIWFSFL